MVSKLLESLRNRLPASLEIQAEDEASDDVNHVVITVLEPWQPIESDLCSFEGWVLVVHSVEPSLKILLAAAQPTPDIEHAAVYQQFLYRVHKFDDLKYCWFSLSENLKKQAGAFAFRFYNAPKLLEAPQCAFLHGSKGQTMLLERFSSAGSILHALPECGTSPIHTDLPLIAVMNQEVFPDTDSCVDLWSIHNNCLNIFEVAFQQREMGFISALFFYANWCNDLFFETERQGVRLAQPGSNPFRGFELFFDEQNKPRPLEKLYAWFLADRFHPEFDQLYICEMLSTDRIRFQCLRYSYDLPLTLSGS